MRLERTRHSEAVGSFARIAGEAGAKEVWPGETDAKEVCSMRLRSVVPPIQERASTDGAGPIVS